MKVMSYRLMLKQAIILLASLLWLSSNCFSRDYSEEFLADIPELVVRNQWLQSQYGYPLRVDPNARMIAYILTQDGKQSVVVNQDRHKAYSWIVTGIFFRGKHSYYVAREGNSVRLVFDGREGPLLNYINVFSVTVSDDEYSYRAMDMAHKQVLVTNDRIAMFQGNDDILDLCLATVRKIGKSYRLTRFYSPDASIDPEHRLFVVREKGTEFVVAKGKKQKAYNGIISDLLASDNFEHLAYTVVQGDDRFVVINGREIPIKKGFRLIGTGVTKAGDVFYETCAETEVPREGWVMRSASGAEWQQVPKNMLSMNTEVLFWMPKEAISFFRLRDPYWSEISTSETETTLHIGSREFLCYGRPVIGENGTFAFRQKEQFSEKVVVGSIRNGEAHISHSRNPIPIGPFLRVIGPFISPRKERVIYFGMSSESSWHVVADQIEEIPYNKIPYMVFQRICSYPVFNPSETDVVFAVQSNWGEEVISLRSLKKGLDENRPGRFDQILGKIVDDTFYGHLTSNIRAHIVWEGENTIRYLGRRGNKVYLVRETFEP